MKQERFDVLVIGGGHAGCEAAMASYRAGAVTGLVTHRRDRIGEMSCNPAIGGVGKGHLVREIDALDGVMGRVGDQAGIQFRLLNRSKGAAVQGPRSQADRVLYRNAMQREFEVRPDLEVIESAVSEIMFDGYRASGVVLTDGSEVSARAVVLTAGTFLRGIIHIGHEQRPGGRVGDAPANRLGEQLESMSLPTGRLKTGTPPRLDGRTIDWSVLDMQSADAEPERFSYLSEGPLQRQVECGITHTSEETHELIRENLSSSAVYGGGISGKGPRYCPSIEDKVVRFAEKTSHQVFLEPEGLTTDTVYPNGISTSLPAEVQEQFVRTLPGLENAVIEQPGYAIEYDYFDPRCLRSNMAVAGYEGLFFAGQINGTTGYEEAAAQGLMSGVNSAAYVLGRQPLVLDRSTAYIGVLVDDLVTRGVTEPYRMFTSRAEFRLSLRADNADRRLTPIGIDHGLVGPDRRAAFEQKVAAFSVCKEALQNLSVTPTEAQAMGFAVRADGVRRTGLELLAQPEVSVSGLVEKFDELGEIPQDIGRLIKIDAQYSSYIDRQAKELEVLKREEGRLIPEDIDYDRLSGLSNELRDKLVQVRPETIGQAGRIDGMTPAALVLVLSACTRQQRAAS